jgi:uncharacterized membrane protein
MMADLTGPDKGALVKTGKLTTVGGAAVAVIAMQFIAFGVFMDIMSSIALVGMGYLACWWNNR